VVGGGGERESIVGEAGPVAMSYWLPWLPATLWPALLLGTLELVFKPT